jgi:hypothetical protein
LLAGQRGGPPAKPRATEGLRLNPVQSSHLTDPGVLQRRLAATLGSALRGAGPLTFTLKLSVDKDGNVTVVAIEGVEKKWEARIREALSKFQSRCKADGADTGNAEFKVTI